jgi:hypothetical protein
VNNPKRKLAPRKARTFEQLCSLPRDNVGAPGWWMLVNEDTVTITAQEWGQPVTSNVAIPREYFDAFVDWYEGTRSAGLPEG